jgi:hypothetical protein
VVLSVSVTAALMLVLVFEASGEPRDLPAAVELSRRRLAVALPVIAVVLVAPFAVLHPLLSFASLETGAFSANPNPEAQPIHYMRPGGHVEVTTAMKPGHLPITITGVQILGTGRALRADRLWASVVSPPFPFRPSAPLPLRVGARQSLWVSAKLTLIRCDSSTLRLSAVRISYRELGLSLTQTVPLDQSTTLACGF